MDVDKTATRLPIDRPGTRVEVRDRFEGGWARGFEVIEIRGEAVRVRRSSDGAEIPWLFGPADLRVMP